MYLVSLSTPTIKSKTPSSPTWTTSKTALLVSPHSTFFTFQDPAGGNLQFRSHHCPTGILSGFLVHQDEVRAPHSDRTLGDLPLQPFPTFGLLRCIPNQRLLPQGLCMCCFLYLDSSSSNCSWGWLLTFQVRKKITQWSFQRGLRAKIILSLELCYYILSSRFPSRPLLQSDFFFF